MNIVIVGCGNVGLETARRLCGDHTLLLVSHNNSRDIDDLIHERSNVSFVAADATDAETMKRTVDDFANRAGRLDALISTVGAFSPASAVGDFASFENNFALNVFGNLSPIQAVLPRKIVVVLCSSSLKGKVGCGACAAGHAAMWGFTRALRRTIGNDTQVMEAGLAMCPARRDAQERAPASNAAVARHIVQGEQAGRAIVSIAT